MYLNILFPSLMALYALYKKNLTIPGILLAWLYGFIIVCWGGYIAFGALVTVILLIIISDRIKKSKEDKERTVFQIISNLSMATLCIIIFFLTDNKLFYAMYYAVIGTSLADTLASGIGPLSKKKPVNILTLEKIEKGASGGVTLLGLIASLVGGVVIGGVYLISDFNLFNFLIISLLGLIGSLIDSILGVLVQSRYRCIVCKKVIETEVHCKQKTKLISGYSFVDNNLVNLLSSIIVFFLSYLLLR